MGIEQQLPENYYGAKIQRCSTFTFKVISVLPKLKMSEFTRFFNLNLGSMNNFLQYNSIKAFKESI